ncbi:unannotated protein [freshwater metagenome]|uniref:Unannotated protein n=1 Tax=freshwater metagenome TaxID=449393 RepID=A0A6J5ZGM1_9ZZZZ|nr:DUF3052 family protein [Actinomycetota bacterium]
MAFEAGELILEIGRSLDSDSALRDQIAQITGNPLVEDETDEVVDGVIMWWREGDGDLEDELVDALRYLSESGSIWLLTPKAGRSGHVEPSDIQSAAPNVGLSQTSTISVAQDWSATHLVARKSVKR